MRANDPSAKAYDCPPLQLACCGRAHTCRCAERCRTFKLHHSRIVGVDDDQLGRDLTLTQEVGVVPAPFRIAMHL